MKINKIVCDICHQPDPLYAFVKHGMGDPDDDGMLLVNRRGSSTMHKWEEAERHICQRCLFHIAWESVKS